MRWGAIFDWDGVVVDSLGSHRASWEVLAKEEGRVLPEDHFERGFGRTNQVIIPEILGWASEPQEVTRLAARKECIYRQLARARGLQPLPGVRELLVALAAAGVPAVVGSATPRENIIALLPVLGLEGAFAAIVSADDVRRSKPDPEVFLLAAARIDRLPHECVVLEDATFGIEAALSGGMAVVGVTTSHAREALARAHRIVDRLDELTLADLQSLVAQAAGTLNPVN